MIEFFSRILDMLILLVSAVGNTIMAVIRFVVIVATWTQYLPLWIANVPTITLSFILFGVAISVMLFMMNRH